MCALLFVSTLLFSQQIEYKPHFTNQQNEPDWQKGLISTGILTFSVIAIYQTGKPIYYNQERSAFHWTRVNGDIEFYDNVHRGMDKHGHFFAASLFAQNIYFMSRWSGLNNENASYTSFFVSSAIMTAMEIHDAYYERWGFSVGDFLYNLAGAAFYVGQQNYALMRNLDFKMSYNFTQPNAESSVIESYPNMSYWLTVNPSGIYEKGFSGWFPNWLNIALGISTTHSTPHKTELLIGLDFNLKRIKTRSVFLNHLLHLIDRYKFPAPAIRLAPQFIGYGLYF
jgi:hypothetical protein